MSGSTTNYGLTKPTQDEFYNVDVQNGNMNIIDENLKLLATQSSEIEQKQNKFTEDANGKLLYNNAKVGATKASELTLDAIIGMTATNVQTGIAEAFQYASNGKTTIAGKVGNVTGINTHTEIANRIQTDKNTMATNINSKGISAVGTETLANLASKAGQISVESMGGKRFVTSTFSHNYSTTDTITLPFEPRIILIKSIYQKGILWTAYDGYGYFHLVDSATDYSSFVKKITNGFTYKPDVTGTYNVTYYAWE